MKLLTFFLWVSLTCSAETLPIGNPIPSTSNLTRQELIWMYTMKTRFWSDGTRITVFYLDLDSKVHEEFCKNIIGMPADKFNKILSANMNNGNSNYFRLAKNEDDVYFKVSMIPGAIGYISKDTIIYNGASYVKIIRLSN